MCVALQNEEWMCIVDELRGVLCSVGIEVSRTKTVACDGKKKTIWNQ